MVKLGGFYKNFKLMCGIWTTQARINLKFTLAEILVNTEDFVEFRILKGKLRM